MTSITCSRKRIFKPANKSIPSRPHTQRCLQQIWITLPLSARMDIHTTNNREIWTYTSNEKSVAPDGVKPHFAGSWVECSATLRKMRNLAKKQSYYPLVSTTIHYYPLLSTTIHYYPVLSITIHYYPLLSTTIHYYPLLSTTIHYYPVLPTTIHINIQYYPLLSI